MTTDHDAAGDSLAAKLTVIGKALPNARLCVRRHRPTAPVADWNGVRQSRAYGSSADLEESIRTFWSITFQMVMV